MPPFASFTEAEHRARLASARENMATHDLDCCISVAPEHLYFLAGYDSWVGVNSPQALIFGPSDDEPTLVVRNVDLSLVRETSWLRDVRTYHLQFDDVAGLIARVAAEKGLRPTGRVGIETTSYVLPHSLGLAIAHAVAPSRVVDATNILGALRLVKSPAELVYLREAAHFADIGLAAARSTLRPGVTEVAVAAAIEASMRQSGGDYWAIPIELSSGERTAGGHGTPRARILQVGDLVHLEFAGVSHRYHATAIQTFAIGEPGPRARQIYALALESLRAGMQAARPRVPVHVVEEASLEPLRKAGLERAAMMRFGYGIGIAYPPIWLETLQISRGFDTRLEPGMVFVLHSCIELVDEGIGVIQGGTYLLHEDGLEMLVGAGDVELQSI